MTNQWGWSTGTVSDDAALVARIVKFYRSTFSQSHYRGMWEGFFLSKQKREHDAFMAGSVEECAAILRNPSASNIQYGFETTNSTFTPGLKADLASREALAKVGRDALIALAQCMGAVRLPAEYGTPYTPPSNNDLVTAIERIIGEINFPNPVPDEFGIQTYRGLASNRAIQAIYQAWRISKLVPGRVVEIGAGLGRTAYYAHSLGVSDYTIVDLPFSCASSSYFLGRALGDEAISFPGETARGIRFVPPDAFLRGKEKYLLGVNVDSLTELPRDLAETYAAAIRKRCKMFLSVNHESNEFTVRDVMGDGIRYFYPFRQGYVEELYWVRWPLSRTLLSRLKAFATRLVHKTARTGSRVLFRNANHPG